MALGDIIAFQDSDDYWRPEKLDRQIKFLREGGYDFVYCGMRWNNEKTGESRDVGLRQPYPEYQKNLWSRLMEGNWISTQTMVFYKYCLEKIRFDPDVKKFQDWDFALQAVAAGLKIGQLDEVLVDVYLQENSITNTVVRGDHRVKVIKKHEKDIASKEMAEHYYKSLADAQRHLAPIEAGTNYLKSFCLGPDPKKLLLSFLCYTYLIKLHKTRQ
ncbi:MAG: glycosyltransferase [Abditibacteriota bacterium]|nr:glycosyltransferase [Abditibacteriota bacterium]